MKNDKARKTALKKLAVLGALYGYDVHAIETCAAECAEQGFGGLQGDLDRALSTLDTPDGVNRGIALRHLEHLSARAREIQIADAVAPHVSRSLEHSKTQSERAAKDRSPLTPILRKLASKCDAMGDPLPNEDLWAELFSELEKAGLEPKEHAQNNSKRRHYTYEDQRVGGKRKEFKYGSFKSRMSEFRNPTT